jgi:murein DD-endopeptidase MepM/ murein hydrolase activator NlpD
MHELLTKGDRWLSPVIKKAAAIFLLMPLMVIGSIPQTASAAEHWQTAGMIAATQLLKPVSPNASVSDLLDLPKPVSGTPFYIPTLDDNPLASFIRKPENILGDESQDEIDSHASSRIPTLHGIITSAFGWRKHPVRGRIRHHDGIDLAAKLGTPVLAPAAGVITFSGVRNGYGNVVEIDHQNGYTTLLAHNSKLLVKVGDIVNTGMVIAKAGSTGISTGVHVHVEVRKNGRLLNPVGFFAIK